ncbi:MAG: hypothetical protein BWX54_00476 [Verrucomicrobia bacterium ADurb.Bin018]|nr:MAG: hypothetical protein BWX54_00476 [Verrucomicrobia bacterium ADurb.Bin018]
MQPRLEGITPNSAASFLVTILAPAIKYRLFGGAGNCTHHHAQKVGVVFVVVVEIGDVGCAGHLEHPIIFGDGAMGARRRFFRQIIKPKARVTKRSDNRCAVIGGAIAYHAHLPVVKVALSTHGFNRPPQHRGAVIRAGDDANFGRRGHVNDRRLVPSTPPRRHPHRRAQVPGLFRRRGRRQSSRIQCSNCGRPKS